MEALQLDALKARSSILIAPIKCTKSRRYRSPATVTCDLTVTLARGARRTASRISRKLPCGCGSVIRTRSESPESQPASESAMSTESDAVSTESDSVSTESDSMSLESDAVRTESDAVSTDAEDCSSTDSGDYSSIASQDLRDVAVSADSWHKPDVTDLVPVSASTSPPFMMLGASQGFPKLASEDAASHFKGDVEDSNTGETQMASANESPMAPPVVSLVSSTSEKPTASPNSTPTKLPSMRPTPCPPSAPQSYPTALLGVHPTVLPRRVSTTSPSALPIALSSPAPIDSGNQAKSDYEHASRVETPTSQNQTKGKGKGKGKKPSMLPPMPQGKIASQMPDWRGPTAPLGVKGDRATNLKPNRNHTLFKGSIYEEIYEDNCFPALPEEWLQSIIGSQGPSITPVTMARRGHKDCPVLLIEEPNKSKNVGMLHAGLKRKGVHYASELRWLIGGSDGKPLSADILESLRDMLAYISIEEEERIHNTGSDVELVPSEAFLRDLRHEGGPLKAIQEHISLLLRMERFVGEADHLENLVNKGLRACSIRTSTEMRMLLKGVLVTGNYVHAASSRKGIDNFVAVSLDSIAKLAETRYHNPVDGGRNNALTGLVKHLQEEHGAGFTSKLLADLQRCKDLDPKDAKGIDPKELQEGILNGKGTPDTEGSLQDLLELVACLHAVEQSLSADTPDALQPARIKEFISRAEPRLHQLQEQVAQFNDEVVAMREFFAEPNGAGFKEMLRSLSALWDALS